MTALALLRAMQFADSGFPGGLFAFSWGLETALAEGQAEARALSGWIAAEMQGRWHPFDRVALAGGYRHQGAALAEWDATVDAAIAADRIRQQSLEAGAALMTAARGIGLAPDPALSPGVTGHVGVVQGALFRSAGLSLSEALAVSALGTARGALSAALRLGRLGAIGMQRELTALLPLLARLAADPPDAAARPAAFAPLSEIALMRPAAQRLFVN